MEAAAFKSAETLREGGFSIDIQPGELIVTRDRSAWNPRMRMSRDWQIVAAIIVAIFLTVDLASKKSLSGSVPLVSFPILLGILLFFVWPLGVNNIHCTREHLEVICVNRGIETGRWLFPHSLVERIHIEEAFGRAEMGFTIVFTVNGNAVRTLRGIQLKEAQIVLLELRDLGFDVRVGT
jgi:hypothetical protein